MELPYLYQLCTYTAIVKNPSSIPSTFVEIFADNASEIIGELIAAYLSYRVNQANKELKCYPADAYIDPQDLQKHIHVIHECKHAILLISGEESIAVRGSIQAYYDCMHLDGWEEDYPLSQAVILLQAKYPDAEISGLALYEYCDELCGEEVAFAMGKHKKNYPAFTQIVRHAIQGEDMFGRKYNDALTEEDAQELIRCVREALPHQEV